MRFLVDASVWLEVLLDQASAAEARAFLNAAPPADLAISRFALHSIGIVLVRRGAAAVYSPFVMDIIDRGGIAIVDLATASLPQVIAAVEAFGFDFDDAFQYTVAEQNGLTIVSFDAHFDRTPRGRLTPSAAAARLP
jgi:predicted nucleic acid-binding protein